MAAMTSGRLPDSHKLLRAPQRIEQREHPRPRRQRHPRAAPPRGRQGASMAANLAELRGQVLQLAPHHRDRVASACTSITSSASRSKASRRNSPVPTCAWHLRTGPSSPHSKSRDTRRRTQSRGSGSTRRRRSSPASRRVISGASSPNSRRITVTRQSSPGRWKTDSRRGSVKSAPSCAGSRCSCSAGAPCAARTVRTGRCPAVRRYVPGARGPWRPVDGHPFDLGSKTPRPLAGSA